MLKLATIIIKHTLEALSLIPQSQLKVRWQLAFKRYFKKWLRNLEKGGSECRAFQRSRTFSQVRAISSVIKLSTGGFVRVWEARVPRMSLPAILFEVSLKYVLMVCLLTSWLQVAPLKPTLSIEGGDIVSEHLLWWHLDSREQRQELAGRVLEGACRIRVPISCKGDPYPQSKRNTVVAAAALKEALEDIGALVRALPFFVYVTLWWKNTISQL